MLEIRGPRVVIQPLSRDRYPTHVAVSALGAHGFGRRLESRNKGCLAVGNSWTAVPSLFFLPGGKSGPGTGESAGAVHGGGVSYRGGGA